MNEAAAKQICSWKYKAPYHIYNYMPYEDALKSKAAVVDSEKADNYLCFWDSNTLVAYINIFLNMEKVFLGIGIAPELCGKSLGKVYLRQGICEALKRYPDRELWVQVRSWNKRAISCYKTCGFAEKYRKSVGDRFGKNEEFVFMCYQKKV